MSFNYVNRIHSRVLGLIMVGTFEAVFDGEVFHPNHKLDLTPNIHYILVVHEKPQKADLLNTWDILDNLTGLIEAPEDWSLEHDRYLCCCTKNSGF